jgi:hypothetical protein
MPRNYSPSTIEVVGDLQVGLRVETSVLNNLSYFHRDQWEYFKVYGRIMVLQLFIEAITVNGAGATQLLFNFTSSSPVIAVQPMCAKCASIAALAQGGRIVWVGGAVATAAVITATAGISDVICNSPHIIGTKGGTGTIGILTSDADAASGTHQGVLCYAPLSDGAYAEANL